MSWDPQWEEIFKQKPWGKYPPEELIRFVARNFYHYSNRQAVRILDVGCGTGACSWYIAREGFDSYGLDGSKTAIQIAQKRFQEEGLQGHFVTGDAQSLPWPENYFDAVIEVVALSCNAEEDTQKIVSEIYRVLKSGGKHFSYTPKAGCWGDGLGVQVDPTSYMDIPEGPFKDMGLVRFATQDSLKSLYSQFTNLRCEYSIRDSDDYKSPIAHWALSCIK